ncbi:hypothetical protein DFJ77DRAFT_514007 [Powellomyces hirtus]|nr:hypothetical protein DFJ77DRAFT_514007 [Powellomyces hirtus]
MALANPFFSTTDTSTSVKEKVTKASADVSTFLVSLANESSLGLYRINEHAVRKVPLIVQQKHDLQQLTKQTLEAQSSVREAQDIMRGQMMRASESFTQAALYVDRIKAAKKNAPGPVAGERKHLHKHR